MYTLVVVDMQPKFTAANGRRVRENCLREILQAIKDNAPIIFLEFFGYDATHKELIVPVDGVYNNYFIQTKHTDDGSFQVEEMVRQYKLPRNFKVCGINTDCCVAATVNGLTGRFPMATIDVIADACDSDWNHMGGLERMKNMQCNVKVKFKEETNV